MIAQKPANKSNERRGEDRRKQDIQVDVDRRKHENRRAQADRRQKTR